MDKPYIKHSQYEIRAMLRNALKSRCPVSIQTAQGSVLSRIQQLGTTSFSIPADPVFQSNNGIFAVKIHDPLMMYEFQTHCLRSYHPDDRVVIHLQIPSEMCIVQRRMHQRLRLAPPLFAWCSGRFSDGHPFRFAIKDISHDGCALNVDEGERVEHLKGKLLRNAVLDFGSCGKVTAHLMVLDVDHRHPLQADDPTLSGYQLSCQFRQLNTSLRQRLDEIVMQLLVEMKRLKRF